MSAAWTAAVISHTAKIVLLALADNANDSGVCWPSIPKIADRCSLDARTVFRAIATLEGGGHLTTQSRPGKATIYRVHPKQTPDRVSGVPPTQSNPRQAVTPTPVTESGVPLTACHPTPDSVSGVETLPPSFSPSRALPLNLPPSPQKLSLRSSRARTRTVPKDFEVTEAMRAWAKAKTPNVDVEAETEKFRDHEFRDPHSNWPAAWRTWMRRAPDFAPRTNGKAKAAYVPPKTIEQLEAEERDRAQR